MWAMLRCGKRLWGWTPPSLRMVRAWCPPKSTAALQAASCPPLRLRSGFRKREQPHFFTVRLNQTPRRKGPNLASGGRAGVPAPNDHGSNSKSLRSAGFGFGGFFFAILRRRGGFEGMQKAHRDVGYFAHRDQERFFVSL